MADKRIIERQSAKNFLLTVGLFGLTLGLTWFALWIVWGAVVSLAFLLVAGTFVYYQSKKTSGKDILHSMGGREISYQAAPELYNLVAALAKAAQLASLPTLFLLPGGMQNALTTGSGANTAIGITEGLLKRLQFREVRAVLAHEMSHIKNNDLLWLGVSNIFTHFTRTLALFGQILFLFLLPFALFGSYNLMQIFLFMILLNFVPIISSLLALALSRTREYQADLTAVSLTGDAPALASALQKIESQSLPWWQELLGGIGRKRNHPKDLWRSHPITEDRINRLREMHQQSSDGSPNYTERGSSQLSRPKTVIPIIAKRF